MLDRVYVLMEEDQKPPWREYVIGVYTDRLRAHAERKRRQEEEDDLDDLAGFRYYVAHHWVDTAVEAVPSTATEKP
jgi:hypothetical protein